MSLIAGCYEKFIWGFKLQTLKSTSGTVALTQLFSYPAHLSPVKAVAVGGPAAASAATDDTIKLYDLRNSTEIASFPHQPSSTTALSFYSPSALSFPLNLIAAAEDGRVSIFDADSCVLLKAVPVHRKAVNDLALHSSGKLALTVGRDSCLAMVNLVRGRRSFCCRIDREATIVRFDSGEGKFFMVAEERISVHDSEDARLVFELEAEKRVLCATSGSVSF